MKSKTIIVLAFLLMFSGNHMAQDSKELSNGDWFLLARSERFYIFRVRELAELKFVYRLGKQFLSVEDFDSARPEGFQKLHVICMKANKAYQTQEEALNAINAKKIRFLVDPVILIEPTLRDLNPTVIQSEEGYVHGLIEWWNETGNL